MPAAHDMVEIAFQCFHCRSIVVIIAHSSQKAAVLGLVDLSWVTRELDGYFPHRSFATKVTRERRFESDSGNPECHA